MKWKLEETQIIHIRLLKLIVRILIHFFLPLGLYINIGHLLGKFEIHSSNVPKNPENNLSDRIFSIIFFEIINARVTVSS